MLIVSLEQLEWLGLIVGSSSVSASVSVPASLVVSASEASVSLTAPLVRDGSLGRTWGVLVPFLWFEVADIEVEADGVGSTRRVEPTNDPP